MLAGWTEGGGWFGLHLCLVMWREHIALVAPVGTKVGSHGSASSVGRLVPSICGIHPAQASTRFASFARRGTCAQVPLRGTPASFQSGQADTFTLRHRALGALQKCTLFCSSAGAGWAVRQVEVEQLCRASLVGLVDTFWFCTTLHGGAAYDTGDGTSAGQATIADAAAVEATYGFGEVGVRATACCARLGVGVPKLYTIRVYTTDCKGAPSMHNPVSLNTLRYCKVLGRKRSAPEFCGWATAHHMACSTADSQCGNASPLRAHGAAKGKHLYHVIFNCQLPSLFAQQSNLSNNK